MLPTEWETYAEVRRCEPKPTPIIDATIYGVNGDRRAMVQAGTPGSSVYLAADAGYYGILEAQALAYAILAVTKGQ